MAFTLLLLFLCKISFLLRCTVQTLVLSYQSLRTVVLACLFTVGLFLPVFITSVFKQSISESDLLISGAYKRSGVLHQFCSVTCFDFSPAVLIPVSVVDPVTKDIRLIVRARPRYVGVPDRLIIWGSFKSILFKKNYTNLCSWGGEDLILY